MQRIVVLHRIAEQLALRASTRKVRLHQAMSDSIPATGAASISQLPYPAEVSLIHDRMGWTYMQNSSGLPLYLYAADSPDESACDATCAQQWPPLLAPSGERSVGAWTIFVRKDGRRQWAFRHRPVYTHRHAKRGSLPGARIGGLWHVMPHFR